MPAPAKPQLTQAKALLKKLRKALRRHRDRQPRFFTPAFRVMYILTAVSAALTWLSWQLMHYLPQAAKMDLAAETGVDPDSVTVLVSQDAYAIFVGLCVLTLLCILVWIFVWLRRL